MKHVTQALWEEVKDFSREDLQKKLKAKRRSDLDKIMSGSVEAQHERTVFSRGFLGVEGKKRNKAACIAAIQAGELVKRESET